MDNTRIRFIAYITTEEHEADQVASFFGERLARQFGGATIAPATGFWAADGDAVKQAYDGPFERQCVLMIQLSVLPSEKDRALTCLQETGREAAACLGLSATAFHIEAWQTEAFHTNISLNSPS
ncbi:hypothetical protein [Kordiimonas sp.]|uniref:hypothetical protein n=1 Tax=Kordiimonas sp. TaxID=1970157 RepID=UPI003A9224AF